MKYTNEQLLKFEVAAKKNRKKLNLITDKSALSAEDKIKLGLCKHFVQFIITKKMKLKDAAVLAGVPSPRMSEITNYKIYKFTVDQLIRNLSSLAAHDAQIKAYLDFLTQTTELPTPTVKVSRKMLQDLKEISLSM